MKSRYSRNIKVIGEEGQRKLASSSVFIVGCGALGGQIAMLLAGAGTGKIGIADFDTIDISNLQRQLFFSESECGKRKAEILARRMSDLNSEVEIVTVNEMIGKMNAGKLLSSFDVIIDATDNPSTKYFIDAIARSLNTPCCIGGVAGFRGQIVMLSNLKREGSSSVSYSEIFPLDSNDEVILPCEIEGVLGPTAAAVASLQASEVIKFLINPESERTDRLISLDLSIPKIDVISL